MIHLVEYIVRRYKQGINPKNGELIFTEVLDVKKADNTKAYLVAEKLEREESDSFQYVDKGTLVILKDSADAPFNSKPVKVFERDFKKNIPIKAQKKALERLVRYLNQVDQENIYYKNIPTIKIGSWCYQVSSKNIFKLDKEDRLKRLKRLKSARKGAITRTKNKISKIVSSYKNTLLPDGYRDDYRFISLKKYLPKQEDRYKEAISLTLDDIPKFDGNFSR